MIHLWLRDRIAKLYAVNKNDGDITPEVLQIEAQIFSKGLAEIEINADVAPAFAKAIEGLKAQLSLSTGYSSAAGRIARMEVAHAIEGMRILLSWLENRNDKDGPHYAFSAFGASVVPVTTSKAQTDMSKMSGHNADPVTSTPIPDRSEPLPVPTADPLQEPPHVAPALPVLVGETEPVETTDEPPEPVTPQSNADDEAGLDS